MLAGLRTARQEGLTLDQVMKRFAVQEKFPVFFEPPPGHWAHGMHERNLRNLWRIVQEESKPPAQRPENEGDAGIHEGSDLSP